VLTDLRQPLELSGIGIEEERHRDAAVAQPPRCVAQPLALADEVEAALRRHLVGLLGHQRHLVGPQREGDGDHLLARRHLDVELAAHAPTESREVGVLDVAAVAAQVSGDAGGARRLGDARGFHRIRVRRATRLAQRRHVVDVDGESRGHGRTSTVLVA
jgi:hypothetical protein